MMILQVSKRERVKQALRKRSVFAFYLAALVTTLILTYSEADHKKQDTNLTTQPQIQLQPVNFEFDEFIARNEGQIFSI
ncbi:hypothetical protein HC752_07380 [Vibrio sp. S9_S30]|uniref:hypothetical protein n=1 Tax=Vibrio sp. S9_S30 TaxID=2720226 RepID=UPI001680E704|nr:hypothetical protein [Vibrio sp. S9_S30]MBD1556754.1 hypothetical protein [Vibrio sp. S9_S30]